jgi:hypothetical protein
VSSDSIARLVNERLKASDLNAGQRRLALAAVVGRTTLEQAIASPDAPVVATIEPDVDDTVRQVWLRSVTVSGFRGVGPATTLDLEPGPGLTLVVGRNGSGKSSFAEGAEAALTGGNDRLRTSPAEWRKQWRNIHDGVDAEVALELQVDGDPRILTVRCRWTGKDISDSVSVVEWDGVPHGTLPDLGWDDDLNRYRPFLSYDDLGKVSGKPSTGFDRLIAVLGLDPITQAQTHLSDVRNDLAKVFSTADVALEGVVGALQSIEDERAQTALGALRCNPPDVVALREVLSAASTPDSTTMRARLTRLAVLAVPDEKAVNAAISALRGAAEGALTTKGTDAEESNRLAELLEAALEHQQLHGEEPCPVCGGSQLNAEWRRRTIIEVARLKERAASAITARKKLQEAIYRARRLVSVPVPDSLQAPNSESVNEMAAHYAWAAWSALERENDAVTLAAGLESLLPPLTECVQVLRDAAVAKLELLEDVWRPIAVRLQGVIESNANAELARLSFNYAGAALTWIKREAERLRDLRLAPFRDQSAGIWTSLRHESNVDLGAIAFVGSANSRRKLDLPVHIDGTPGGVSMLSNGELHALGLALFLPRSTAPDSPFRFVIIDDPVQAMDPAKVEGLAKVLHKTASDRQVVVFTHDDRLADALRRLMLKTRILEVVRRENSHVEIHLNLDPVERYLADARQIARTERLPEDLAALAAAGSCRDAIETACQRVARQRLRAENVSIQEIDERLLRAETTDHRVALAVLGDSRRIRQLMPALNRRTGDRWAADVLRAVREGVHHPRADLDQIITNTERFCEWILTAEDL